jgi:hypothetical protein
VQVGNIVRHFLTDQIGVILEVRGDIGIHVLWTTQGLSLFGPGHKEWCFEKNVDLLTTA